MAQFLHGSTVLQSNRRDCYRLMTFLLLGALLGSLTARFQFRTISCFRFEARQSAWILIWFRSSLFSCLLAVSFLLRRSILFDLLFFLKGAFVSFILCVFSHCGVNQLFPSLPPLVLQSVLPLPLQFHVASIWLRDAQRNAAGLVLLAPLLLLALLGALISTSLLFG